MAGNTLASPDQIKTLSIDFGDIRLGSCLSSVSSKTSNTTGFLGYKILIALPRVIGS